MRKYLFTASLVYEFPILRPVQEVIRRSGGEVRWFFDRPGSEAYLREGEQALRSAREVMDYCPEVVFTAGNLTYDFFPGVKVQLFHGMNIDKRGDDREHWRIRGMFDMYCTHGPTSTPRFEQLARKAGHFRVVETGWPKIDNYFPGGRNASHVLAQGERPTILYCSTFSRGITSTPYLFEAIEGLARTEAWDWIITLHPLCDAQTVERYRSLEKYPNVEFYTGDDNTGILRRADVMVCDSSSIIVEFMTMRKPVVTFRNTMPGPHLIDIGEPALLGASIRKALERPVDLMRNIEAYVDTMNPHMDGLCSQRAVDAADRFIDEGWGKELRRKPLNLVRKYQLRRKLNYFPCIEKLRSRIFEDNGV